MEMAGRAALKTPLFGWMIRDAIHGSPDAKYYFVVNVLLVAAILTYFIGFAFLITLADIAAFLALAFIVYMSAADSFSLAGRKYARESRLRAGVI
jgi:biotin transporter BioY